MIHVWIAVIFCLYFPAFAAEFTTIKLSPHFEQYINQPKLKSNSLFLKAAPTDDAPESEFDYRIRTTILGGNNGAGDFASSFPTDGEESPLLEEIRNHLSAAHREIGQREVTQLDFINRQFNLGTDNLSGFSWQKPYGVVHVFADRQVTPNLFGANWLIQDTFTFDIEATTFLEKTNEAGITSMTAAEIGAFAGITFKRVYTYYHYAPSFKEGLVADFSKLFLPFIRFNPKGIANMLDDEIMKREDVWTISTGGIVTTPPAYNFSVSAGILAEAGFEHMVSIQSSGAIDLTQEKFRLNQKTKKSVNIGATLSLQVDFFKLLKLTIMEADLSYEYASSKDFTLGMSSPQWQHILSTPIESSELKHLLGGRGEIKYLEPYVIRLDESESSSLQTQGSLLVWGKMQKNKTEQIRVIKDQQVRTFFKNYSQSLKIVQNAFSRLFSAVVYKLFKLPVGAKNASMFNKQLTMEYEATHPQSIDPNIARIDSAEQFSFVINQSYEAHRTDRWIDKRYKNDVIWFIDFFTTLPKDYKTIIRSGQLKGPLLVESNLRVEKAGFSYFLGRDENEIFGSITEICGSKIKSEWSNAERRAKIIHKNHIGAEACVKSIGMAYLDFKGDYQQNYLKPALKRFKDFLTKYFKKASSLDQLISLFGKENCFINGQLKATTSTNATFVTSFSSGQFRGLGVIDNFKRANGSRQPASIVSE